MNKAEAEFWRRSQGYDLADSSRKLQFECGGQQWVNEVRARLANLPLASAAASRRLLVRARACALLPWSSQCFSPALAAKVAFPVGSLAAPSGADLDFMTELLALIEADGGTIAAPAPIEQRWSAASSAALRPRLRRARLRSHAAPMMTSRSCHAARATASGSSHGLA